MSSVQSSPPAPPPPRLLPDALRRELESIYAEADRRVAEIGVACWVRGICCDFRRADHHLYASSAEVDYIREKHSPDPAGDGELCPFWRGGVCTERERRPLGCRTYFCDERYRDELEALYGELYDRLRRAADRVGYAWEYVPFVRVFATPNAPRPAEGAPE